MMAFVIRLRLWRQRLLSMIPTNLAQAEKRRFGKRLRLLTPILPLQRTLNLIPFHHLVWVTITYKDNTTNDVTAPVKRLAAPTVETRLLDNYTQTPVTVTGAEPGSTVVLYNNDDEVGTAVADASWTSDRNTECPLQNGWRQRLRLAFCMGTMQFIPMPVTWLL